MDAELDAVAVARAEAAREHRQAAHDAAHDAIVEHLHVLTDRCSELAGIVLERRARHDYADVEVVEVVVGRPRRWRRPATTLRGGYLVHHVGVGRGAPTVDIHLLGDETLSIGGWAHTIDHYSRAVTDSAVGGHQLGPIYTIATFEGIVAGLAELAAIEATEPREPNR